MDGNDTPSHAPRVEPARVARRVPAERLRRSVDPRTLPFASTAEVPPLDALLGQDAARESLAFGVEVDAYGFNLFVAGESGSGRATAVRADLDRAAAARPAPADWVYVHNFAAPDQPLALALPAGRAAALARELDAFVRDAQRVIRGAFESEDHAGRRRAALADIARRRRALFDEVSATAHRHGYRVDLAPGRFTSVPLVDGEPLTEESFAALTPDQRAEYEARSERFELAVGALLRQLRQLERDEEERSAAFEREAARAALEPLLAELRSRYADVAAVVEHLTRVGEDMSAHVEALAPGEALAMRDAGLVGSAADDDAGDQDGAQDAGTPGGEVLGAAEPPGRRGRNGERLARYRVNVLIDSGGCRGAPVVVEDHPTPDNLSGRVDYRVTASGLVADFLQVRAGALHRANGGFLVLRAEDVLHTEDAWNVLKRALLAAQVRVEPGEGGSVLPATALRPAPVPLKVKVVLVGTEEIYQALYELDPDFRELFKVKVEFSPDLSWSREAVELYAAFLSKCVRDRGLRHLDGGAIARVVEHGARMCGDQDRLSARLGEVADVVTEASYWAGKSGRERVARADVERALRSRYARSSLLERRVRAEIARRTILIETEGRVVGQVNGLTVVDVGDGRFSFPARITATVAAGAGTLTSIEREVELSGPIHAKGVLTLRGYLGRMYGAWAPLAMAATIAFEQSYSEVEGDSASLAELLALLSALADAPLAQGIAVTGSVDQRGQVQAVGEVTRKIEGFFAVCRAAGLDGAQGVVMPAPNAPQLVLDEDVVEAVRAGRFHVWAVRTVDEALEILTEVRAASAVDEVYPPESVHGRAAQRVRRLAEQALARGASGGASGP